MQNFKPFSMSNTREKRDAVVKEVRKRDQEGRYLHLARCSQQGQCIRWEEHVVERKIGWKELWEWERARTSFLIRSTYDAMPTPANLVRWRIEDTEKCICGKKGTLRHILSNCTLALERYTWRHNQILEVIGSLLQEKIKCFNDGDLPKVETIRKMAFQKEGTSGMLKSHLRSSKRDERWSGKWKVMTDLGELLVFPVVQTGQRPDIIVWCEEKKECIIMELTVPWEENFGAAEERKATRYEELIRECEEGGWKTEYYHLGIGARGYVERKVVNLFRHRFCCTNAEIRKFVNSLQETAERTSFWIWMKREDRTWLRN